jgi:hypothetical protein
MVPPTFTPRRLVSATAVAAAFSAVAAPLAIAAGVAPQTGSYSSSKSGKNVSFQVVKRGKGYDVSNFGIYCRKSSSNFGAVVLTKALKISSAGAFSYRGPAMHIQQGQPVGSVTLHLSGKFATSTKATGSASFRGASISGCPAHSFTATKH